MLVCLVVLSAVVAGILAQRVESGVAPPVTRTGWARAIAYWMLTVAVAFEMVAGGVWDLLRIEFVRVSLVRLGYPLYLLYILGPPKILCAITLLAPRFARLKEWAYAGAIFNYVGAAASLLLTGRPGREWAAPLEFAMLTMGSWALRPAGQKLMPAESNGRVRAMAWCVPVLITGAMIAVAFATLPSGAPPR